MNTATAEKLAPTFDIDSILAGATKAKTKGSKSTVPEVSAEPETRALLTEIRKLKEEVKSLENICDMKEEMFVKNVAPAREDLCLKGYVSSIKVADSENIYGTLSWKDAYSKIDIENVGNLAQIVGSKYQEFFTKDIKITVKDTSQEGLNRLMQVVGSQFGELFEVEQNVKPTSRYTTEFFTAFKPEERTALRQIVRQYSPALKCK